MSRYTKARPCALPGALAELRGPTSGVASLPTRLHWGPDNRYDLADTEDTSVMYERVIREASSALDLAEHLDADTLRRLWADLIIPREIRAGWEARFLELRHRQSGAAA
ncbi:hypothetical protein [Streptomyces alanosinicus]|uniref:Uncharacterized protein n=1 Tax=Streptomyces alanosinicus TaxID=68171 RepID=A0A918IPU5_9ACTN|nr:hypothetical protein [Streptomyces alanosinicus]GGW24492.1 hypothetical protein GCM10010339_94300 [Streptomyces alanosinicus]